MVRFQKMFYCLSPYSLFLQHQKFPKPQKNKNSCRSEKCCEELIKESGRRPLPPAHYNGSLFVQAQFLTIPVLISLAFFVLWFLISSANEKAAAEAVKTE